MKQETKATIAYLAAIIFVIICIALMAVTPAYGQNQTVIKDSKGEVVYIKIKTASGYIVKDKNGVLLYTVVENDTEKRVYDASGRLISVEKKAKKLTFSGGKDSLASLLWTREHITKNFTTVFCDTGWEHPLTYEYINRIADKLHLDLVTLKSKKYDGMVDLARQAPERIDEIATIEQELRSAFFGPDKIPARAIVSGNKYPDIRDVVRYVEWQNATGSLFDDDTATSWGKVLPNVIQDAHNTYELTLKAVVGGGWRFCYTPVLTPLEADNIGDEMGDNLIELLCNRIEWIVSNGYELNL